LLAVSKWHVINSRYGVRIALIVLFQNMLFYFIALGLKSRKNNSGWLIVAGITAGAGFYTYIAYRITPVIALFLAFTKGLRDSLKRNWKAIAFGLFLCILVLLPLAKFTMEHYETFSDRMERTAVWNQPENADRPLQAILHSSIRTLGLMTYKGDSIFRHNVNSEPMLSPFLSSFFYLGLLIVLLNIRKPYALFILVYLFLTLLPGMLTVDSPHAARTLGAVVPTILIASIGVLAAFQILRNSSRLLSTAGLTLILTGAAYAGFNDGLLRYGQALDALPVADSALWGMDREKVHVADLLNNLGMGCDAYLSPQLFFHATIEYLTYSQASYHLLSQRTDVRQITPPQKIPILILQPKETNLWWLRDEPGKRFFKWWNQTYKMEDKKINLLMRQTYGSFPQMTSQSDQKLILQIRQKYPDAKELSFRDFVVFLIPNHPSTP
jgi:hypothetical protein